jgi:AmiR/NasT family two-component response regulator
MKRRSRKSLENDARLLYEAVPIMQAALEGLTELTREVEDLKAQLREQETDEIEMRKGILAAMGQLPKFDWDAVPEDEAFQADEAIEAEYRSY